MTKQELAEYMTNLLGLMESKEDAGRHRGQTMGWEYNRCYEQLITILRKEQEDEARKSNTRQSSGNQTGADKQSG